MNDYAMVEIYRGQEKIYSEECSSWLAVVGGFMTTERTGQVQVFNWTDGPMRVFINGEEFSWCFTSSKAAR